MLFALASLDMIASPQAVAPLDYFLHSAGPATRPTLYLGWVFAAISVGVCVLIAVLLVVAMYRKRPNGDPKDIGRGGDGLKWIYIGTGVSTMILFGMMIYMLVTLNAIAQPAGPTGLTITVTGYDWWWSAAYADKDSALRFTTANEIHIPVGVPVLLKLKSADVIHAFWVPLLAGKTQMIPGQTNRQWIQADQPGTYRGQCTQYCGLEHAHMGFEVIAETPAEFRKWRDLQTRQAAPAGGSEANAGQKIFMDQCSGCHTVRGTEAVGAHAPDLTHLLSRHLIAAALLTNSPENRMSWIAHAQEMKPGARMPDFNLTPSDAAALSAYLSTLE
jgi:cytochrome c oxidase subunit 2